MTNIIKANEYGQKICEALGIDVTKAFVTRIVIDVRPEQPVKVYVEMLGSEAMLDVELPTTGVEIVTHGKE